MTDLVNVEFVIDSNDLDFNLTSAQVIKVLKVILYKMNIVSKNSKIDKKEYYEALEEKIKRQEQIVKSSFEESN